MQADTVAPGAGNPQGLNRYSYVLNSPLRYKDPTGHIEEEESLAAASYLTLLLMYGVSIDVDWGRSGGTWNAGLWTLAQMSTLFQGVKDLASKMGGAAQFQANLGGVQVSLKNMGYRGFGEAHHITLKAGDFDTRTVVHELAHAWDAATGGLLSWDMQRAMGASEIMGKDPFLEQSPDDLPIWYDPGSGPPPCGMDPNFNRFEDFAESVTAYAYPVEARNRAAGRGWPYQDTNRGYNYASYYDTPRGRYMTALFGTALTMTPGRR